MSLTKLFKKLRGGLKKKLEEESANVCLDTSQVNAKMLEKLYQAKIVENALNVGEKIPISELEVYTGKKYHVKELLKKGPIVLTFFRGSWCQFCVTEIKFIQENIKLFEELGATVISVSPQSKEETAKLAETHSIEYDLIADPSNKISKKFGLSFTVTEDILAAYGKCSKSIDLKQFYGKDEIEIPVPATYVIDTDGKVVYAFINEDFRKRADVAEVASFVRKCKMDKKKYFSRCSEHECVIRDFLLSHHKNLHKKFQEKKASCEAKKAKDKADKAEKAEKDKLEKLRISSEDLDPFKFCLRDEEFLESFESYLTKTYCLENLLFYSEVEQFEVDFDSWTPAQAQEKTRKIFETYVMVGSELEVNIDDTTREAVVKSLKETPISKTIFSNALQEIYKLMETDSYSKWKRTKEYAKIWAKKGSLAFLSPTPTYATAA